MGLVVAYQNFEQGYATSHERATCNELARRLAALKGFEFAGDHDPSAEYPGRLYFVPRRTLVNVDGIGEFGIASEDDLFGGLFRMPSRRRKRSPIRFCTKVNTSPFSPQTKHTKPPPGVTAKFAFLPWWKGQGPR